MRPISTFIVSPSIPEKLKPLQEIIYNLWWCWDPEAISLLRRIDEPLWEEKEHNPVQVLGDVSQQRLEQLVEEDSFMGQLERVHHRMQEYLAEKTWFQKSWTSDQKLVIAYFSAEFGISECIPTYSGGLGVLAGDYLKSASDLGLPVIGISLMYQEGYFRQYLDSAGWQGELHGKNDFYNMPITLVRDQDGPVNVVVDFPGRKVFAQIWQVKVGRTFLYCLDSNVEENTPEDRKITSELYGGDIETRIQQEILLGIGGVKALQEMGIHTCDTCMFHMNEGHSAFLGLERIRMTMEKHKLNFWEALELTRAGTIFTTHTPVPAGMDMFPPQLIDRYLNHYYAAFQISREQFLSLGQINGSNLNEPFSMAILALKLANMINGVSKLHAKVSRKMWQYIWPQLSEEEVPISYVTNGIHYKSWISHDMADLYMRYLGPRWASKPEDQSIWQRVQQIPSEELWRTHERRRERMVSFARNRLAKQLKRRGAMPSEIIAADEVLNPEALTIGFARRFATYKRALLIFQNPERLEKILNNKERPVQIIIGGKAHPKDNPGKEIIQKIVHFAHQEQFRRHVIFLEDYDMIVSRYLVQGVDVWLNTPLRLQEASGTSGMKAAANGVINISVLDGWWDEAFNMFAVRAGWAIGRGEMYKDRKLQDEVESNALYELLEGEVIPMFYERGRDGLPREWIARMKSSMTCLCPIFNTTRMVREYYEQYYSPAAKRFFVLHEHEQEKAKKLARWKLSIRENWNRIKILYVKTQPLPQISVGSQVEVEAVVYLGQLMPEDVEVQIYFGPINYEKEIVNATAITMIHKGDMEGDKHVFTGKIHCTGSGKYGYSLRILPRNELLGNPFETRLILWST